MVCFDDICGRFNIELNEEQREVVMRKDGQALVLAGPGSGKTTVIVARTAYLILEAGVKPENILTVTFNRAAGKEMGRRFENTFGRFIKGRVHFSTLHSFCNMVLGEYERLRGKSLKRIEGTEGNESSKRRILKNIYYEINEAAVNDEELENLLSELSLVKNTMVRDVENSKFSTRNFPQIYRAYEEYKRANLMIDFDDMLTYTYSIFNKFPQMLENYRRRYRHIQVDEGQDLSSIQFEIIKCLVKPDNGLFIVADDDQSIYGFRGAEPEHILGIDGNFPGCGVYHLGNNYRSSGNIVDMSSRFIKRNSRRYDKRHKAVKESRGEPLIVRPRDERGQLKLLLDTVKIKALKEGKSIGILYRNNLSSVTIADILDRNNIGFDLRQNKLFFFNHWVVLDIIAFLKFAMNQGDKDSFLRICFKMNRFLSKGMIEHGLGQTMGDSFIDNLLTYEELKEFQVRRIERIKLEFKNLANMQVSAALNYIENDFKYLESAREYCEITGGSFDYIYKLFGVLKTLAVEHRTIPAFLQRLGQLESILSSASDNREEHGIMLSTIHSAKGLEYDGVIMVDLTENEIPGRKAIEELGRNKNSLLIEEERRLFYVGITRTREELLLICPQYVNGEEVPKSIFVSELAGILGKAEVSGIEEGSFIRHKQFGKGVIVNRLDCGKDRVIIEADFSGVRKKLDFTICLENGLVSLGE